MWPNPQFIADLVTFTQEILNGKLHFLCSESQSAINTLSQNSRGIVVFIDDFEKVLPRRFINTMKETTLVRTEIKNNSTYPDNIKNFFFRMDIRVFLCNSKYLFQNIRD